MLFSLLILDIGRIFSYLSAKGTRWYITSWCLEWPLCLSFTLALHKISYRFLISVLPLQLFEPFCLYKLICFSKKWVMKYFSFHAYHLSNFISLKLIMFSFFPSCSSSSATLRTFLCSLTAFGPGADVVFQPFAVDNMSINSGQSTSGESYLPPRSGPWLWGSWISFIKRCHILWYLKERACNRTFKLKIFLVFLSILLK